MSEHHAPSFLQRNSEGKRHAERQVLANWIAANLVSPGTRLFVASGTTAAETAQVVLKSVASVHITTNSVPLAWFFIHLVENGEAAPHVSVAITGGDLRAVTGIIAGKPKIEKGATLLLSPHGLTEKALTGNRDVDLLKPLLNGHRKVIMPVSWSKLNRDGASAVKHLGHWKQVVCQLVVTEQPHKDLKLTDSEYRSGLELLNSIEKTMRGRLKLHRVPLK